MNDEMGQPSRVVAMVRVKLVPCMYSSLGLPISVRALQYPAAMLADTAQRFWLPPPRA